MEREKQPDPSPARGRSRARSKRLERLLAACAAPWLATSRKTARRLILLAVLIVVIIALHVPVLRGIAGFLIVDQPLEQADVVVLLPSTLSSQDVRDAAVQLFRDGTVARFYCSRRRHRAQCAMGRGPRRQH